MEPISGICSGTVRPAAAGSIKEADRVQPPREGSCPAKPVMDEYAPEEKREPSGLYWPGKDEDGSPKIFFDRPEQRDPPEEPAAPEASGELREKTPVKKTEPCTGSTDQVDREIERLKRKRDELKEQISRETDPSKAERLEKMLAQVERELRQKDNDVYRRQHSVFS